MRKSALKSSTSSPLYNVMMFSAFWALQIFITKLGFISGAEVLPFQIISILMALLILAIMILPKYGVAFGNLIKQEPKLFWNLFFANIIQSGFGTSFSIIGISLTDAINAGFLVKLATVTTILFAWLILKERLTGVKILTVFAMLSGAYLLTTKGQILLPRVGDLFILAACVCWSLGNVLVRKFLKTQSLDAEIVTLQKPIAGLPVILVLVALSIWNPDFISRMQPTMTCCGQSAESLPYALGNGFFLAMAWTYLNRTLKASTASYMTMMSMVTPVIVSVLAMVFLHETLTFVQVVGAGTIILSGFFTYLSGLAQA